MGLAFNSTGMAADEEAQIAAWRQAAAAVPTAQAFAETYLGLNDDELSTRVENGKLIVETAAGAKNVMTAAGREPRMAYVRLEIALTPDVIGQLSEIIIAQVRAWEAALH